MQNESVHFGSGDIALKGSYQKITHEKSVNNRLNSLMAKNINSRTGSYKF